jgi:PhzF family phenazine biosynthesis protein
MFSRFASRHHCVITRGVMRSTNGARMVSAMSKSTVSVPLFQVDSFSRTPFAGNPAAVCLLTASTAGTWPLPDETLLKIAEENNLSETAFLLPMTDTSGPGPFATDSHFHLRWFTPTKEVDLCGHATLATAAVLLQKCGNKNASLHFDTKSGELIASAVPGESAAIEIELPLNPPLPVETPSASIQTLIELVLGADNEDTVKDIMYSKRTKKLVFELDSSLVGRHFLENLTVSPSALLSVDQTELGENSITGVIVTLLDATGEYDFISRYFAPWNGIDEDPVTGSAHTVVSPMWTQKCNGQTDFSARQCSPRGGDLRLRVDVEGGRLLVSGEACVVVEGTIRIE